MPYASPPPLASSDGYASRGLESQDTPETVVSTSPTPGVQFHMATQEDLRHQSYDFLRFVSNEDMTNDKS
nr:uncharacterized protein CTRU02_02850 [Colletotrichum truncatum]KAF6797808.1 hypothetical protein CTRU02_02850 [Colletotrichum truncatum]